MTNLLQDGSTWLAGQLNSHAGESVTYKQQGTAPVTVTAVPAEKTYDVIDAEGMMSRLTFTDWIIKAADLSITPRKGDRITRTLSGVTYTYEALPLESRPAVEWLDTSGIVYLIHTKRID